MTQEASIVSEHAILDPSLQWFDLRLYRKGVLHPYMDLPERHSVQLVLDRGEYPATILRMEHNPNRAHEPRFPRLMLEYELEPGDVREIGWIYHRFHRINQSLPHYYIKL